MLSDEELLKLKELEEKATSGPWTFDDGTVWDGHPDHYPEQVRPPLIFSETHEASVEAWHKEDLEFVQSLLNAAKSLIASARREKEYRAALEWYADRNNYTFDGKAAIPGPTQAHVPQLDCGDRAREALKKGDHDKE